MTQMQTPGGYQASPVPLKPHRGTTILVLGILGLVACGICGIIAWVMGNQDLKEMDQGIMDPAGRGNTSAGRICGIISVVLSIVAIVVWTAIIAIGISTGSMHSIPR
jgi:hypothetical protein